MYLNYKACPYAAVDFFQISHLKSMAIPQLNLQVLHADFDADCAADWSLQQNEYAADLRFFAVHVDGDF